MARITKGQDMEIFERHRESLETGTPGMPWCGSPRTSPGDVGIVVRDKIGACRLSQLLCADLCIFVGHTLKLLLRIIPLTNN